MKTVYFELTTACVANCEHCHVPEFLRHGQPVTLSTSNVMFDLLILKEKLKCGSVVFSGGEPTLHPDLSEIVKFAHCLGLNVSVISNGFNPEILREISQYGQIWVSLDYYRQQHDNFRRFKGLWKNYLSIADIANIRSTLMSNNLNHIKKLTQKASKHDRKITIVPFKGENPQLAPTPEQVADLLLYIFENGYAEKAVIDDPSVNYYLATKNPEVKREAEKTGSLCNAAHNVIRIDTGEYVHPCPFLTSPICHITDPQINEKIAEARKKILQTYTGKCFKCTLKNLCGGCRASLNTHCFMSKMQAE